MKKSFLTYKIILFLLFTALMSEVTYSQVTVNMNLLPPYSPYFRDYSGYSNNKLFVSLLYINPTSNAPIQVYLSGSIVKDDNSLSIQLKDSYHPTAPITLMPNIPQTLAGAQMRNVFGNGSSNDLAIGGMSIESFVRNQALSEGNYTVCIKVRDFNTNNIISEDCRTMTITYGEPPQIFSPADLSSELAKTPQNLFISWSPAIPFSPGTSYRLRIVKLLDGITATDALNFSTQVVFEKSNIVPTNFPLDMASGVKLDTGAVYAMQVTAVSANAYIKNGGKSEPIQFLYKGATNQPVVNTRATNPPKREELSELVVLKEQSSQISHLKVFVPFCGDALEDEMSHSTEIETATVTTKSKYNSKATKTLNNKTIQVNNTHDFYLRWEDFATFLKTDTVKQPLTVQTKGKITKGIVYNIQIFSADTHTKLWETQVFNHPYYSQSMGGLPFVDKKNYTLYIEAFEGSQNYKQITTSTKLAESYQCDFTYEVLTDVFNLTEYQVSGKLLYKFQDDSINYPLNSNGVVLKRYLMVRDSATNALLADDISPNILNGQTPSSIKVNLQDDGSFTTYLSAHPNGGDLGIQQMSIPTTVDLQYSTPSLGGNQQTQTSSVSIPTMVKGRVYEYYKLEINSDYYVNPKTRIELTNDSLKLGDVVTNVISYTLNAEISKGYYNAKTHKYSNFNELNPKNLKVLVQRQGCGSLFADLPYYEGDMKPGTPKINTSNKTISKTGHITSVIGKDGKERTVLIVDKLICNFLNGDTYKITITQDTVIDDKKKTYLCGDLLNLKYVPSATDKAFATLNHKTNYQYNTHGTLAADGPPTSSLSGQLVYRDPSNPKSVIAGIPNTEIGLIVTYLIEDDKGNKTIIDPYHIADEIKADKNTAVKGSLFKGAGEANEQDVQAQLKQPFDDGNIIIAREKTDSEGRFTFKNFANMDTMGSSNSSWHYGSGTGEHYCSVSFNGKLHRTVRVVMCGASKNKWFNPDKNIDIQPNDSMNMGVLTAYLKTYKLIVMPRSAPENLEVQQQAHIIQGSKIELTKKAIYKINPNDEIEPDVIESQYLDTQKGCEFSIPMHNKSTNGIDDVKINITTSDTVGENSYARRDITFPVGYDDWKRDVEFQQGVKNNEYSANGNTHNSKYTSINPRLDGIDSVYYQSAADYYFVDADYKPVSVNINVYLEPQLPIISGRVLDATNTMRSVEDGTVRLMIAGPNSSYSFTRNVSEVNNNGYFTFTNLPTKGYNYQLNVKAKGYTLKLAKQLKNSSGLAYNLANATSTINFGGFQNSNSAQSDTITYSNSGNGNIPSGTTTLQTKMGQQINFPQILMNPNSSIKGWVFNKDKKGIPAFVKTTRSILKKTTEDVKSYSPTVKGQTFELNIPSSYNDTLFVVPEDLTYFNDTIVIPFIPSTSSGQIVLEDIILKERLHLIELVVIDAISKMPIVGATVKVLDYEAITNNLGKANFSFRNASVKHFWYKVTPPANSDYIAFAGELTNAESKNVTKYTVKLNAGAEVSGVVTSGGNPVPYAEVWVNNGNNVRKVVTDNLGKYALKGVAVFAPPFKQQESKKPEYTAVIKCNAPTDTVAISNQTNIDFYNLIGDEKTVKLPSQSAKVTLNFDLQEFKDANISRLHGFRMHVTKLTKNTNGTIQISGTLDLSKSPTNFQLIDATDQNPGFENLITKADARNKDSKGRPYLEANPGQPNFALKLPTLKVKLVGVQTAPKIQSKVVSPKLYSYNVQLENSNNAFLSITKNSTLTGSMQSKAHIVDNSFNFPGSYFNFNDNQFYLAEKQDDSVSGIITAFKSSNDENTNTAYRQVFSSVRNYALQDDTGKDLVFKFLNFNADSKIASSYITPSGTIVLKPNAWTLNPLLKTAGITDTIAISLPEIGITADSVSTGGGLVKQISIKFEKWNIVARNCEVSPEVGGIHSTDAEILTGAVNVPIKDFTLQSDLIYMGKPQIKTLRLGGIWDMTITKPENAQFGLDPKVGRDLAPHYKLCFVGDPAAKVSGLPGFADDLNFQAVSLLSNGEQIVSFAPNCENIKLFNIANFKPVAINSYADNFNIDGIMDLGIPRISNELTYKLLFEKQGTGLKLTPVSQDITFEGPGNIKFESLATRKDNQVISKNLVQLYGTVKEPGELDPIRIILTKSTFSNTGVIITGTSNFALNGVSTTPQPSANKYDISIKLDSLTQPNKQQYILFGTDTIAAKFQVDKSDMIVKEKDWDFLRLQLHADDAFAKSSGFGSNPLNMVVFGEIKSDPDIKNQTIAVSGTETPFGDFTLIYDLPGNQMTGTLNIVNQQMGGVAFGGAAEMAIGGKGFYFVASGMASAPPFGEFSAGILVGSYNAGGSLGGIPQSARSILTRFSVAKDLPCALKTKPAFNGFFVTGRKNIPILSINESINVFVASASVFTDIGLEASAWGAGTKDAMTVGVSGMLYGIAELKLASITCTSLTARADASLKVEVEINLAEKKTANVIGCAEIKLEGSIGQGLPKPWGGCTGDIFYFKGTFITLHAGIDAEVNLTNPLAAPTIKCSAGVGDCGGVFNNCDK